MTTRITVAAGDIRIGDIIYNGLGTSKHPTDAWEAITQVNTVDGLVQLITGRLDGPHGEFWFEPEETVGSSGTRRRSPRQRLQSPTTSAPTGIESCRFNSLRPPGLPQLPRPGQV